MKYNAIQSYCEVDCLKCDFHACLIPASSKDCTLLYIEFQQKRVSMLATLVGGMRREQHEKDWTRVQAKGASGSNIFFVQASAPGFDNRLQSKNVGTTLLLLSMLSRAAAASNVHA